MSSVPLAPSLPIQYSSTPREGPAATPFTFNFGSTGTAQTSYSVDYTLYQNQQYLSLVQSMYIDNSANTAQLSINVVGRSQQNITFPGGFQGYVTVLVSGAIKFTFSSTGTALVNVYLINEPVMPAIWSSNGTSGGGSSSVTIAGPDPLPVSLSGTTPVSIAGTVNVDITTPNPLPVSESVVINTFYGVAQAAMTGSAIQLSTILPAGSPTSLRNCNLQGDAANTGNVTIGSSSGVTAGAGLELAAFGFMNYGAIDTTKIFVIGASGQHLNIEAIN